MSATVVVGAQWGDEGKGKLIDVLAANADMVVRFQGGSNAGHTLVVNGKKTVLHLIPSGILHADKMCLIASGVVVDIFGLAQEIRNLKETGFSISPTQLLISDNATALLPYHKSLDQAREKDLSEGKIGTTGKGIGPAYEDRAARRALVMSDLYDKKNLLAKLEFVLKEKNALLTKLYDVAEIKAKDIYDQIQSVIGEIEPYRTADVSLLVSQKLKMNRRVLFEGAQGTLLDIHHGTYPYVTSSSTLAGSGSVSAGVGPHHLSKIVGVFKAYCTRVGAGPFPTELTDAVGAKIQKDGHEFGSTTGRARRCGWLDLVALKYAIRLNGINSLAMMKLDVLSDHEKIGVCTGYKLNGELISEFPTSTEAVSRLEPVIEYLPGWKEDLTQVKAIKDLPIKALNYIDFVTRAVGCPIDVVSVGPDREQTLWIKPIFQD
ncbi:MAG: adenylosuccinate synthase [Bdellovibrionaceae bacterium]|nr:adenylosuccinate synthase [Bdellovibrio sp.]